MYNRRLALLGAAIVTLIMLVSSMGLVPGFAGARPGSPAVAASGSASLPVKAGVPSTPAVSENSPPLTHPSSRAPSTDSSSAALGSSTTVPYGISQVEHSIAAGQVNRSAALFPRSPSAGQAIRPDGQVTPSYPVLPAPMGLADLGQGSTGPYEYNSSSFAATITINSFQDYNPGYAAWEAAPDWMTFQLNTLTDNTSYPGADDGTFWIQNVVHFNNTELQFEDNIWNFSSPAACLGAGTLLTYDGQQDGCFYYVYGPTYSVTYPFTMTLYNNVTTYFTGSEFVPIVTFGYLITNASATIGGTFDVVTWNGPVVNTPQFQVNGFNYDPIGYLFDDSEIILGGNGGGANAVIQEMDATMRLLYLNGADNYVSVPSAYDYGEDTGETSQGISATYTGTTETLTQGPSALYGLWNTADGLFGPGLPAVTQTITGISGLPSYSFAFAENRTDFDAGAQNWSYWPSAPDGTISALLPWLPGGNGWCIEVLSDGNDSASTCLSGNGSRTFFLPTNPSVVDTPIYLSSTAQARAFETSGIAGVQSIGPNLWINDTVATLDPAFRQLNDYDYPTFVLFAGLNLSVDVTVNALTQNPTTFNYTNDLGESLFLPGYSQGYYFNFGLAGFTVTNVTTTGNQSLFYGSGLASYPIQAVEFFGTFYSVASNIVNSQDDFGVDVLYSYGTELSNISSQSGANAFLALGSGDISASNISSNGTDIGEVPSYGAIFEAAFGILLDGVTVGNDSLGIYLDDVTDATIENVTATNFSLALFAGDFYDSDVESLTATSGAIAVEAEVLDFVDFFNVSVSNGANGGIIEDAYMCALFDVDISNGTGIELYDALDLTISDVIASGINSWGVEPVDADFGTVANVSADAGAAVGLLAAEDVDFTVVGVSANNSSVGAEVEDSEFVTVANVSATNSSVGVAFLATLYGLIENESIGSGSLGVYLEENAWVNVTNFNASEPALSSDYFVTEAGYGPFATAAVQDLFEDNTTVFNGTALDYNYGILSNDSDYLRVQQVSEWNGLWGIGLNNTQNTTIFGDFLYGNQIGLWANETVNLLVVLTAIEGSTGYGIWLNGGSNALVVENNFVANNGASVDGVYNAANVQVGVASGVTAGFTAEGFDDIEVGNYWSDWNPDNGPYVVNATSSDTAPLPEFTVYNWLLFVETGLPAGTLWGVTLDGVTYTTTASLIIIPSWVLGDPILSYVVDAPTGYASTPNLGTVDYTGLDQMVTFDFSPAQSVTFSETGLTSGSLWSATLNGVTMTSTTSTIVFSSAQGTFDWSVSAAGYAAAPPSGMVTVTGIGGSVSVMFTAQPMYAVTFAETGLTSGTSWSVTLNGVVESSTSTSIVFEELAGSYSYTIGAVTGYGITSPASGTLTVTDIAVNIDVSYVALPSTNYAVTFTESGLATGTVWSLTLNGATEFSDTTTIVFSEAPGSYSYAVGAVTGYSTPTGGSVTVTDTSQDISVTYTAGAPPVTYTLTFTESGLTSGTPWSVTVNGEAYSSMTGTIVVLGLNGTYTYTVASVTSYTVSPSSGTAVVTSSDQTVTVTYTPVTTPATYTITFTETGLPSGTSWSVTVNGATYIEATATITVTGVAGAYTYSVGAVTGYTATPGSGTLTLTSSGASETIAFAATTSPSTPSTGSSGLSNTDWAIIGLVIGLVIGALVIALIMRGRGGSGGPPEQEPVQTWNEGEQPAEGTADTSGEQWAEQAPEQGQDST